VNPERIAHPRSRLLGPGQCPELQKVLSAAERKSKFISEETKTLHAVLPGPVARGNQHGALGNPRQTGDAAQITPATINDDLRRRDFTANGWLSLNPGSRGCCSTRSTVSADVEAKLIRILHTMLSWKILPA